MSRSSLSIEEQELNELREAELRLEQLRKEFAEIPQRLAREQKERETTMPPLAEIEERRRRKEHDQMITARGQAANILRDQNRSLWLLLLLLTATGTLIWWGIKLMQG